LLRVRGGDHRRRRRGRLDRRLDQHRAGGSGMSADPKTDVAGGAAGAGGIPIIWEAGAELPTLTVTPDRYVTVRYAGASGDFNPIHVDDEFARQVGLPGKILHGLWTMAQVARAQTEAVGGPQAPAALKRLSVEFRGMAVP